MIVKTSRRFVSSSILNSSIGVKDGGEPWMFVYDIYRWEILSKYSCTVIVEELPLGGALLTTKTFLSEVDIVEH